MADQSSQAQWHYIGHYGQLGPLTDEQMAELVRDGVVQADTYVWRDGMSDWSMAAQCPGLDRMGLATPPPSPPPFQAPQLPVTGAAPPVVAPRADYAVRWGYGAPMSDRNRVLGGVLNLIPGVGRIYLGYVAIGVLQALLTVLCGVGLIWGWVDALFILSGGLKHDGYGRRFSDS